MTIPTSSATVWTESGAGSPPARNRRALPAGLPLAALMIGAAALRLPLLPASYWGDEAISVGIASRPLLAIPQALRFDGSPPLYYLLLHVWMGIFGTSPVATHSLSLLLSVACVPVGWWCGTRLCGRRAGWAAAALIAVSPYLTDFGVQSRMYALLALAGLWAVGAWIVALRSGGRRRLASAAGASVVVLYTHDWGLYLVAALAVAGLIAGWRDRAIARRAVGLILVSMAGYLAWVPSFVHQLGSTGAPWASRPQLSDLFAAPWQVSAARAWPALLVASLIGVAAAWWTLPPDRKRGLRPAGCPAPSRTGWRPAPIAATVCAVTLLAGWIGAELVKSWSPRYLGVAVVPALVLLGALLVRSRAGRICLAGLMVTMLGTAAPAWVGSRLAVVDAQSDASSVIRPLAGQLQAGDLVVAAQVSQLPLVAYYAPGPKLRYATPLGAVRDPRFVDWTHLQRRLLTADPDAVFAGLLASIPVGGHVLLVDPLSWATDHGDPYSRAVAHAGVSADIAVLSDPSFTIETFLGVPPGAHPVNPVTAMLLVKTGGD